MVNIVRSLLGLDQDDGEEIAKAVKQVKKKEKKVKKAKKVNKIEEKEITRHPRASQVHEPEVEENGEE